MNDEGLIADMYNPGNTIAGVKRSRSPWNIFNGTVIVTVLDFLQQTFRLTHATTEYFFLTAMIVKMSVAIIYFVGNRFRKSEF